MKRLTAPILLLAGTLAAPLLAQGQLTTIERGHYLCELPGDAEGLAGVHQEHEDFTVKSASRYSSPQGEGTYLRRGDLLIMTSGPRNGDSYAIVTRNFLRKIENGEQSRLRCVRQLR